MNPAKHWFLCVGLLAAIWLICGCEPRSVSANIEFTENMKMADSSGAMADKARITYTESSWHLNEEQEQLLIDYMNLYYTSLARLKVQNPAILFVPEAWEQAERNRMTWEVSAGIRSMQKNDLTLSNYSFTLKVQSVMEQENGDVTVRVSEDYIQNFTAYPGIDSRGFNIRHTFGLTQTERGWLLNQHRQTDSLNNSLMGSRNTTAENTSPMQQLEQRRDQLLEAAKISVAERDGQGRAPEKTSADYPYYRKAAVEYARQWVGQRNPIWRSYDGMGGNCQNFVSQAILAGGIPMDYRSPAQWKWYGDTPNASFSAAGRSPAWTGVQNFLSYVQNNSGYGMAAAADAPYYEGEPGDVIHLGVDDNWRHTVMITQVIRNKNGEVVDYLIASNSADLLDFPVSAFYYQNQLLIKIYGWNKRSDNFAPPF